jgi:hypothetical protein
MTGMKRGHEVVTGTTETEIMKKVKVGEITCFPSFNLFQNLDNQTTTLEQKSKVSRLLNVLSSLSSSSSLTINTETLW